MFNTKRFVILAVLLVGAIILYVSIISAESEYSYGVDVSSSNAVIWFKSYFDSSWVDVNYKLNNDKRMNFRMNKVGKRYQTVVNNVNKGDKIEYSFIYKDGSKVFDTDKYVHTVGNSIKNSRKGNSKVKSTIANKKEKGCLPLANSRKLIWSDEFENPGLNINYWNTHIDNVKKDDKQKNISVKDGKLVLKTIVDNKKSVDKESISINTEGKITFQYGLIEAKIKYKAGKNTIPSFSINGVPGIEKMFSKNKSDEVKLPLNGKQICGNIDIMKYNNKNGFIKLDYVYDNRIGVFPFNNVYKSDSPFEVKMEDEENYHIFSIEWTESQIKWYVDRDVSPEPVKVEKITHENQEELHKAFYININMEKDFKISKEKKLKKVPYYLYVDWVRIWQ
jgi:hypothetical protein